MREALDSCTPPQLQQHLQACDASFVPPLSQRVPLADYAAKLCARARRVEVWEGEQLVGLVALYTDNPAAEGFISNVSVLPSHQGLGLGARLLQRALALARDCQLRSLRLEVGAANAAALALYGRHGFREQCREGDSLFLIREIP